ncbi:hypothetical protein LSTR_LSTR012511 [Laodelphax striatellus]|uniref:Secreted protein n=1 Tax=Laodelphax striatellus TaxID=195883 RepID=A0A482XKJ6_LAOST|nr:hypothetical protein LSTR_LSTR012511 [Laodelphax striatellus]
MIYVIHTLFSMKSVLKLTFLSHVTHSSPPDADITPKPRRVDSIAQSVWCLTQNGDAAFGESHDLNLGESLGERTCQNGEQNEER